VELVSYRQFKQLRTGKEYCLTSHLPDLTDTTDHRTATLPAMSKEQPAPGRTRRNFIRTPLGLAGSIAVPSLLGGLAVKAKADGKCDDLKLAPRYYPLARFKPEVDLTGKLAVITGASRGNGRAVGEALSALGVDVIGTSRNPSGVPDPPAFPLLALDITDPASVLAFVGALQAHPLFQQHGRVDILANNAGRFVLGEIVPLPPTDFSFYLTQRDLGLRTVYFGHVMVTNAMLPLMPQQGYSRIIFTASIASYTTGATLPAESFVDTYNSGKAALRVYANNLDSALRAAGSSIRVATVNPYAMNTALAQYPHPVYTQPVNSSGSSQTDPVFNSFLSALIQLLANGLPPSMVGETYAQLLSMTDPEQNVVVGSAREPLATKGGNALIEQQLFAENQISAVPFECGR
jgi:NAD(P)-dependent dehydrogenase (short-subunit alcohol dehydrogenase family)